jgi:3D-(3,5/4)-trihydroxycyclohexane-1,2-dione acylhydrolase (decyclizing)
MSREETRRMTMAQALIAFLQQQYVERDGVEQAFFAGIFGIFGHGIVGGIGQALQQNPGFRYYQSRNEQAQVHAATAYAKVKNRMQTLVCTSSIGPGATNMITGAATATINRLPVLLLPGDIFARRNVAPVLQQRPARSPWPCLKMCRPRPTTIRSISSASASGTSPGPVPIRLPCAAPRS